MEKATLQDLIEVLEDNQMAGLSFSTPLDAYVVVEGTRGGPWDVVLTHWGKVLIEKQDVQEYETLQDVFEKFKMPDGTPLGEAWEKYGI